MLAIACCYRIKRLLPEVTHDFREKLLAMGLIPGNEFTVLRFAPLKKTVQIVINGDCLALRLHELQQLEVEAIL